MNTNSASIAEYFGATIVLLSISTSLTVLVLNVHHRGSHGKPVSSIVRLVVLDWLAKMLGLGKLAQDKTKGQINTAKTVGGTRKSTFHNFGQWTNILTRRRKYWECFACNSITSYTYFCLLTPKRKKMSKAVKCVGLVTLLYTMPIIWKSSW